MPSKAQGLIEQAMAELSMSGEPNDQAFCASMAALLNAWSANQAADFLYRIRMIENRHAALNLPLPACCLN